MKRILIVMLLLLAGLSTLAPVWGQDLPEQVDMALEHLGGEVGQTVTLDSLENWDWSEQVFADASLGCPQPDESYAQVVTRGFQFTLYYQGQTYDYRVAEDGSGVVLCTVTDQGDGTEMTPEVTPMEPTVTPTPEVISTPIDDNRLYITYADIQFSLSTDLATDVTVQTVEAVEPAEDVPFFGVHPAYTEFTLNNFAVDRQGVAATISVYPLAEFETMLPDVIPDAAEALNNWIEVCPEIPDPQNLPHLAPVNASQVFAANLFCLDFASGDGLRYLTAFRQDVAPFTNQDLLYIYQGISADGQFYVSITAPVTTETLPDMPEDTTIDDDFVENYNTYLNETIDDLTVLDSTEFTPDLSLLDNLVASFTITSVVPPAATAEATAEATEAVSAESTTVSWDEARSIILNGDVVSVAQTHSLEVTIQLADGSTIVTQEPAIDDVFAVIEECGEPCANILIATE